MIQPRGIIYLEGADASGKTTLARFLVEKYGARYLHCGLSNRMWKYHLAATRRATRLADDHLVIIDRCWISEQIYGPIFRGSAAYTHGARCLDRILQKHAALTVLCVPSDAKAQLQRHAERRELGGEAFERIENVVARFADLSRGNVAHPGELYVDQLIRFQDYGNRPDVYTYDLDRDGGNLKRFAGQLLHRLEDLRSRQLSEMLSSTRTNFLGSVSHAQFMVVGDRVSPRHDGRLPLWPFVEPNENGSAGYLNARLHECAFDETRAVWANANCEGEDFAALVSRCSKYVRFIALGNAAANRLTKLGRTVTIVPHPAWWRRFKFNDEIGYRTQLQLAMMR